MIYEFQIFLQRLILYLSIAAFFDSIAYLMVSAVLVIITKKKKTSRLMIPLSKFCDFHFVLILLIDAANKYNILFVHISSSLFF